MCKIQQVALQFVEEEASHSEGNTKIINAVLTSRYCFKILAIIIRCSCIFIYL